MKMKIIILGIIAILLAVGLSGCNEQTSINENSEDKQIDTDGDGYPDDVDDFPTDSNLHEKTFIVEYYPDRILGIYDSWTEYFYVESDYKYFEFSWSVSWIPVGEGGDFDADATSFHIQNPEGNFRYTVPTTSRVTRILITEDNWGDWQTWFNHYDSNYNANISYEIRLLK